LKKVVAEGGIKRGKHDALVENHGMLGNQRAIATGNLHAKARAEKQIDQLRKTR
jgi:hypothetical protein